MPAAFTPESRTLGLLHDAVDEAVSEYTRYYDMRGVEQAMYRQWRAEAERLAKEALTFQPDTQDDVIGNYTGQDTPEEDAIVRAWARLALAEGIEA